MKARIIFLTIMLCISSLAYSQLPKQNLYDALQNYKRPVLVMKTSDYIIRIDFMNNDKFRYASWKSSSNMSNKPDLILLNGKVVYDGSGGNRYFTFLNKNYLYKCIINYLGTAITPPGILEVYKEQNLILKEKAYKVDYLN